MNYRPVAGRHNSGRDVDEQLLTAQIACQEMNVQAP
jgi:hypothetical protein